MSEVADACQVVMVSGRVIAGAGNLSIRMAMLLMKIYNSIYLGKWKGSTSFKRFRAIKGDDYEFINICSENPETLAKIEREMEAHNLMFARLPDLCGGDGNTQYVIARSDMQAFAAFLMDHNHGDLKNVKCGPITESDYAKTAVHPESGEYTEEFKDLNRSAKEEYHVRIAGEIEMTPAEQPLLTDRIFFRRSREKETPVEIVEAEELPPENILMITDGRSRRPAEPADIVMHPLIHMRTELLQHKGQVELIYDEPLKESEKWAVFPVHDGEHVVVIPREDMLLGNTTRKEHFKVTPVEKPPKAMMYTDRNYVVIDLRTGKQSLEEGKSLIESMRLPDPSARAAQLANLRRNVQKNVGSSALFPAAPKKKGGR